MESYTEYSNLVETKQYEQIYDKLLYEIEQIQDIKYSIMDTESIKSHLELEIRKQVFGRRNIPTPVYNTIILLGKEYEFCIKEKTKGFLATEYLTDFQVFINENFLRLSDISKYYTKLNNFILEFDNLYYNAPETWNLKNSLMKDLAQLVKQKVCEIFFFNNFTNDEYIHSVKIVIKLENKLYGNEGIIFQTFVPFIKIYFLNYFADISIGFKNSEHKMKIFTNFLNFFKSFENLYENLIIYKNKDSINFLFELVCTKVNLLIENLLNIKMYQDYENEHLYKYSKKDFETICVQLNSISYVNNSLQEFCAINSNFNLKIPEILIFKIRTSERKITNLLELYVRNIFENIDLLSPKFSRKIIKFLEKKIFFIKLDDLHEDVKGNIAESILMHLLSQVYLLDLDELKAEEMLYEFDDIKKFIQKYQSNIPSYCIIESYLKIFMCSTENLTTFIDNFLVLSGGIFSFEQIVLSLKNKEYIGDLLQIFVKKKYGNTIK